MDKFEYKYAEMKVFTHGLIIYEMDGISVEVYNDKAIKFFNEVGKNGWELVSPSYPLLFKRKVVE